MDSFDLYEAIGGASTCRKLSTAFYARVAQDSILRPLFPGKTFKCAIEEFSAFLTQLFGGPSEATQRRWWLSLHESHLRFQIGQRERDAWMHNMKNALDDVQMEEPARGALLAFFERSSAYLANSGPALAIPTDSTGAAGGDIHGEIAPRWEAQQVLDAAVAALRQGEGSRAVALAETPRLQAYFQRNRAVFANFLGLMIPSGHSVLLEYVRSTLVNDPGLSSERYSGRTLLHEAAAAGNLTIVELLLQFGVDPNTKDAGGHTPLYCVGNECAVKEGATVVKALIRCGAHVEACDGVKHCTALHMAARRGNVDVAAALLECGADMEARDSAGDTPLRRAVNCGKTEVAAFLLAKGADRHSKGSRGFTPVLAARAGAMAQLLQSRRK